MSKSVLPSNSNRKNTISASVSYQPRALTGAHTIRRRLIGALLVLVALVTSLSVGSGAQSASLLQPGDVSFEGFWHIGVNGNNSTYSQGLTHRYVNGEQRFLTVSPQAGAIDEFSVTGQPFGTALLSNRTGRWTVPSGTLANMNGIWFEAAKDRLWVTNTVDYNASVRASQITLLSLPAGGGAATLIGHWSVAGVNDKRMYGGCRAVPAWAQAQVGGPYECGSGGYTSLLAQGGGASLGPTMFAIDEPTNYASGSALPLRKRVLDIVDSQANRGVRKTIPQNYFDGGDTRPNPPTRPTSPTASSGKFLSPNANGDGLFVWGDSYYNTGVWIDTPSRRGFLMIASLCKGSCWYQSSTLAFDGRQFEMHVFDPSTLGSNQMARPASMTELVLPNRGTAHHQGNSMVENVAGATFDANAGRLYLLSCGGDTSMFKLSCGLFSHRVNGGSGTGTPPVDTSAPTVNLTSPSGGASMTGTATLTANASDNTGVASVWFTVDGSTVGAEDYSSPYQVDWDSKSVVNGGRSIRAMARDTAGNTTASAAVPVSVNNTSTPPPSGGDTIAPTVSVTSPSNGATVSGKVTVSATATDNVGVQSVQFSVNGVNFGVADTSLSYARVWDATAAGPGTYVLRAVARDAAGNVTTSAGMTVTVGGGTPPPAGDTTAPAVSITSPSNGAIVSGKVTVSATATDNVGVQSVQFSVNGVNFGVADTSLSYARVWDATAAGPGTYVLRAVARDAAGNVTTSAGMTVTVGGGTPPPAGDTTAPAVSITSPSNGAIVSGKVTVSATATDNVGVQSVQFSANGVNFGVADTSLSYARVWDATAAGPGTYVLRAVARDAAGNVTTSAGMTVTVGGGSTAPQPTSVLTAPTTVVTALQVNRFRGRTMSCSVALSSVSSPDGTGNWAVQFQRNGYNVGSIDGSAPYSQTITVPRGASSFRGIWTRPGQPSVTGTIASYGCE